MEKQFREKGHIPKNGSMLPRPTNNTLKPDGEKIELDDKGINGEFLSMEVYYLKYEYREEDMAWGISMILLCILLIVICLFLNITVLKFYGKKAKDDVVSLIYSLLSFADILVAMGAFFTVICLIQYLSLNLKEKEKDFVYPSVEYVSYISFFISSIAVRISVFLNAMLSIVRTIMIRDPFSQPSKVGICTAVGLMTLLWTFLTVGEIYTINLRGIEDHWTTYAESTPSEPEDEDAKNRKQYLYLWYFIYTSATGYNFIMESLGDKLPWSAGLYSPGGEGLEDSTTNSDNIDVKNICESASLYGTFLVAFVVPCVVSIVCLIIQSAYLRKPSVGGSENNNNKKVTNTIMMLTLVFVFCNAANIIIISIAMFHQTWFKEEGTEGGVTVDETIMRFYRSMFAVLQLLPLINSTLSPVVLIWRGSALKEYIKDIFGGDRKRVSPQNRSSALSRIDSCCS